jgi:lipoprotein-anchoring transpeptidase ErfK/SrfK
VRSSLRSPARTAFVAGALALLTLGSGAQAAPAGPSLRAVAQTVHVVGSGSLNWTVAVRARPSRSAKRLTVLKEFRSQYRPQFVLVVAQVADQATGKASWYKIVVPGRPNGRTGWIPAGAATVAPTHKVIVIDRSRRQLELWQGERRLLATTVAVGATGMETPLGLFYVQWKFVPTAEILGAYAFETSAYSKLSDWPGGGIVGIHGTYWPWLLGKAVSHGCVRVHNRDILRLRGMVEIGTPIKIVA